MYLYIYYIYIICTWLQRVKVTQCIVKPKTTEKPTISLASQFNECVCCFFMVFTVAFYRCISSNNIKGA